MTSDFNYLIFSIFCINDFTKFTDAVKTIFRADLVKGKSDELKETERFIYFGWWEAFPLAILKETGEIVEMDWADDERIMGYVAKDQQTFLDLLFALEENSLSGIISKKEQMGYRTSYQCCRWC